MYINRDGASRGAMSEQARVGALNVFFWPVCTTHEHPLRVAPCRLLRRILLVKFDANDWLGLIQISGYIRAVAQPTSTWIDHINSNYETYPQDDSTESAASAKLPAVALDPVANPATLAAIERLNSSAPLATLTPHRTA